GRKGSGRLRAGTACRPARILDPNVSVQRLNQSIDLCLGRAYHRARFRDTAGNQETEMAGAGRMRRVVTGHDAQGRAVVLEDGEAPVIRTDPNRPGYAMPQLWITDEAPAPLGNHPDPTQRATTLSPPPGGSVIRIVDFPPSHLELSQVDGE